MSGYPQCFPEFSPGSQFGPRVFKGAQTFHKGRDQAAGNGSVRRAPAAGVVVGHGQNVLHGHWIGVRYDGARHVERMHQVQAGSRLSVGTRFKAGDALAKIGHPHLWLTEAARQRRADWSGGSKKSSTGSHSHQELERDGLGGISIDPAGAEAAEDWARVIAHQTRPASTSSTPLITRIEKPEEDFTMARLIRNSVTKAVAVTDLSLTFTHLGPADAAAAGRASGQIAPMLRVADGGIGEALEKLLTADHASVSAGEWDRIRGIVDRNRRSLGLPALPAES